MTDIKTDLVAAKTAIGKENIKVLFISRFKHEGKNDKGELRILAITPYRMYVITTKQSPKVEFSFHILEIFSLEGSNSLALSITIQLGEKQSQHRFIFENEEAVWKVISYTLALLRTNFVNANVDKQVSWKVSSPEKQEDIEQCVDALTQALSGEGQPCGSFSLAYLCVCDYYKQASDHNAEVCWDIDKIYAAHRCKDFKLDDFERLDMKDLVPLIAALSYNTWFTRFVDTTSRKLSNEVVDAIVKVIRRTLSIEEFVLVDCHLNKDQIQKISLGLGSNPNKVIKRIDISKNNLEDKGVGTLCGIFGSLDVGLELINFSDVGMSNKGGSYVANCMKNNKLMASTLSVLNLSGNALKVEGTLSLCEFLSQPNVLTELSLCNTECPLDLLFTALHRGCQLSLQDIDFSGNPFLGKKSKESSQSLSSVQQFFSMSRALKTVNLSSTKLPASGVKAILVGLLNNPILTGVGLDISSNELKSSGAAELTSCLKEISLSKLNLANNGLEQDLIPICEGLQSNGSIKELDLSFNVSKTKNTNAIAEAMGEILIAETPLTKLSVADCKLRVDAAILFDCLGTNETLTSIDIRGNAVGDMGARLLAKALQINTKLREILLDRNNITSKGLQDIAQAMERNYTLHSMPLPMADLTGSMKANNSNLFIKSYGQIEQALTRNQSSKASTPEQAYKVHQGLLMSSIDHYTQHTDECVIQLEDTISKLECSTNEEVQKEIEIAGKLIKEADLFRQVLLELYSDPEHSKNLLDDMFSKVTKDVINSVECVIKDNVDKMLKSAANVCPTALNKEEHLKKIKEELLKNDVITNVGISDSITHLGQSEIAYKLCESNLLTATNIAEQLKLLFVDVLQSSINTLNTLDEKQVSDSAFESEAGNGKVDGELNNTGLDNLVIDNDNEEGLTPPLSTPAANLLSDITNENNFDLAWNFSKPREQITSVTSLKSEDSDQFSQSRNRLNTDTLYHGKKKKTCSLKRRPTVYKQRSETEEIDIPLDTPNYEKTEIFSDTPTTTRTQSLIAEEDTLEADITVRVQHSESFNRESSVKYESDIVDMHEHSRDHSESVTSMEESVSYSVVLPAVGAHDDVDGEDSISKLGRLPSIRAFDDVSTHSSQLNVRKTRAKPARGRRAPTKISKLAHMASTDEGLDDDDDDDLMVNHSKPRPKSEMPVGVNIFAEDISARNRAGSEKVKRAPARPSPPSKPETPTRPDPPVKTDHPLPPVRPERPKKPDSDKKPEPVKEKKVKPPPGAFQLPQLPSLGGILKKRHAPKAPDTVDGTPEKSDHGVDSETKIRVEIPLNDGDCVDGVNDSNETNTSTTPVKHNTSSDTAPPKPPPPGVMKKPISPSHNEALYDHPKTPEHAGSTESPPAKLAPVKKPPRGIPLGGLGGPALMAEMNKKLHITPKTEDDDHSTVKAANTPPKPQKPNPPQPQKPTPPQRPPSIKRANTEGRPNVPDRPKSMIQRQSKTIEAANDGEEKNVSEPGKSDDVDEKSTESSDGQSEEKKLVEESANQTSDEKETKDGDSDSAGPVTAYV